MIQIKRSELKQLAQDKLGDDSLESQNKVLVKISTSLAARTSYTMVGDEKETNYERMIALHDRLISQNPPHSSPLEHCCLCVSEEEYKNSYKGQEEGWFRNYKGFKSYRHIIESQKKQLNKSKL
jgi:hypothetical protein